MEPTRSDSPAALPAYRLVLRALSHRNYRLFFAGQCVSLVGTWMQQVAIPSLVFHLTTSPFVLGFIGFAGNFPLFALTPIAGVWSDLWDRRRLLMAAQFVLMIQALLLAALALTGAIDIAHVVVLSIIAGVGNAVTNTTLQAFVADMVPNREDLGSAIGLNSFVNNGARMIGPALGGLLVGTLASEDGGILFATGVCFLINGFSFLGALAALTAIRTHSVPRAGPRVPIWQQLKEGVAYALGFTPIRSVLLLMALVMLLGIPYSLMPLVARDMLHSDARTVGFLMAADGVGAVIGGVFVASRRSSQGLSRRVALAAVTTGLANFAFSFVEVVSAALALRVVYAFALMTQVASTNNLVQSLTDDRRRGRVMSLFMLSVMGMIPLGSLLMGTLSDVVGLRDTYLTCGLVMVAAGLAMVLWLPHLRPQIEKRQQELSADRAPVPAAGLTDVPHA
ncbi:MAG: MFS transporter [Gemmataceae bacterium]|nr:MFS transporter [Gemmataceae bacterium]